MDNAYGGLQAYMVLEKNNNANCPLRECQYDEGQPPNLINLNGIATVSTSYVAPYTSFDDILLEYPDIISWIFDMDTGEGRYYDKWNNPEYWTPMQKAIGKVQIHQPELKRIIEQQKSVGEMYPILHEGVFETKFSFDKVYIDKKKLQGYGIDSRMVNLEAFLGPGIIDVQEYCGTAYADYYLMILYIEDLSNDTSNIARSLIFPCAMFDNVKPVVEKERTIVASLSGYATYGRPIPADNIPEYEPDFDPDPGPSPDCDLFLTVADDEQSYSTITGMGDNAGIELWCGEKVLLNQDREICGAEVYIHEIHGQNTPNLVCKIYEEVGGIPGAELAVSDVILGNAVLVGWNFFTFSPTEPLSHAPYVITFESTASSPADNYYEVRVDTSQPYVDGHLVQSGDADYADLPDNWSSVAQDLWCKLYSTI